METYDERLTTRMAEASRREGAAAAADSLAAAHLLEGYLAGDGPRSKTGTMPMSDDWLDDPFAADDPAAAARERRRREREERRRQKRERAEPEAEPPPRRRRSSPCAASPEEDLGGRATQESPARRPRNRALAPLPRAVASCATVESARPRRRRALGGSAPPLARRS